MNYIKDINLDHYNMVIEIPKGTKSKFELVESTFDRVEEVRKLKYKYPFYYGCFPQTLAKDGDALDAILISNKKRKSLDIVKVKVLGQIKTVDNNELDLKVVCVAEDESIKHIEREINKVIKFLSKYKGKKADMYLDTKFYEDAEPDIIKCYNRYLSK